MTLSISRSSATADVDVHPDLDTPRLRALVRPGVGLWTPSELRDLTSTVAVELADALESLVRYVPEQRWWARLGLTRGVELWVLTWLPGQGTEPHDHGGASGSFTVLTGSLSERYRYPERPSGRRERVAGEAIGFGAGHAHEVRNTGDAPAASVHAYSPPLVPTREYASLDDIPAEIPPLPAYDLSFAEMRAQADLEGP